MATYRTAVRRFKRSAKDWLTDEDSPAVTALENIADELDGGNVSPALISQYGLAYRSLLKRKPVDTSAEVDPLDDIIPGH